MQATIFKKILLSFITLGFLGASLPAQAVAVFVNVPVPEAREVVGPPGGYQSCYDVPSGYYDGYYVHAHRACEYIGNPDGGVWVSGFWQCSYYHHGICRGPWSWNPSHWAHYGGAEFGVVWHNADWYRGGPSYGHGYERGYDRGDYDHGHNRGGYYRGERHGHGGYDR